MQMINTSENKLLTLFLRSEANLTSLVLSRAYLEWAAPIPKTGHGNLADKTVSIHIYEDRPLAVFLGHRKLEFERVVRPAKRWTKRPA